MRNILYQYRIESFLIKIKYFSKRNTIENENNPIKHSTQIMFWQTGLSSDISWIALAFINVIHQIKERHTLNEKHL